MRFRAIKSMPLNYRALFCIALALFFGLCPIVFALNLEELIGPETSRTLLAGEKPVSAQFRECKPELIPRHEILAGFLDELYRDLNPTVMVEALYLYEKPPEADETWNAAEEASLYNATLALSTLAGLQYYSASRGMMRTFYETSSVIDGPLTKRQIPDPVYTRPPEKLTIYANQRDSSFGDNIYQYDYYSVPGGMIFIQQNLSSLRYGIIPAIGKNMLHSIVAVLDAENYLLVYISSMAKAASLPGMKERISNSFANRAEAVYHWFSDQADKAFKKP